MAANKDMASYMREYRRSGRDKSRTPPRAPKSAGRVNVINHRVAASAFDIGARRELRGSSGVLMWPNRAINRTPAENIAEVEAALRRVKCETM